MIRTYSMELHQKVEGLVVILMHYHEAFSVCAKVLLSIIMDHAIYHGHGAFLKRTAAH